jgi:hypothetical protein
MKRIARLIARELNGMGGKAGIDATLMEELICCDRPDPMDAPPPPGWADFDVFPASDRDADECNSNNVAFAANSCRSPRAGRPAGFAQDGH